MPILDGKFFKRLDEPQTRVGVRLADSRQIGREFVIEKKGARRLDAVAQQCEESPARSA
jgi:hypothetical protein